MENSATGKYQKSVGKEISRRIEAAGLSSYAFAVICGVPRAKLSLIERGKPTNYPNLHKIAKALGCKVDDLLPKDVP